MEKTNLENLAVHQASSEEIINSSLVINKLQKRSLKEILAKYSDSTVANQTNVIERAAEAIGLIPNIQVEKTVTINRPANELYNYWRNLTNLPSFMKHLKSVTNIDQTGQKSHWVANAPLNLNVEWDAQIVKD
ncbi:MAG: SRPBCC family protein, partial [Waterburya sp.]